MTERANPTDGEKRVVRFRPRSKLAGPTFRLPNRKADQESEPVADLAKFEGGEERDDFRHRMTINALAFAFTIMLIVSGVWIVNTLADMRKNQDCYLSGQRRCTPIVAPPTERY